MSIVFVALIAGTLLAADTPPQTLGLPKWIRLDAEERFRLEGSTSAPFRQTTNDAYALNRLRLDLRLIPLNWLKLHFQSQDARVWWKRQKPYAPPFQNTWDLRLAYIELGDIEKNSLRAGRQELAFGEERLLGNTNWTNTARSFDAVRGHIGYRGLHLDAFASSVVVLHDGRLGNPQDGNNLHGLYGGIEKLMPHAIIEPYLLWRLSPRLRTETGTSGNLDSKTLGIRWVGTVPAAFDYNIEVAHQTGSLGTDRIRAWAGHWLLGYQLPKMAHVIAEYNFATGDANARDGIRGTFDHLYPTSHDKYGLADQVGWKNIKHFRTGLELKPARNWAASAKFSSYWLADAHDALYNTAGTALARDPNGRSGRFVGTELDGSARFTLSRLTHMGIGFGHLFPGAFLKHTTPGKPYNYPYLFISTGF